MKTFKSFISEKHYNIDLSKAIEIGNKLNINWKDVNEEEFRKGLGVEMEHAKTVDNDIMKVAKIALDHLREDPKYYTKLATIENS